MPRTRATPPSGGRAVASAVINRSQILLAMPVRSGRPGSHEQQIVAGIDAALGAVTAADAPVQVAMLHNLRATCAVRTGDHASAVEDLSRCLDTFTRQAFPFQHAVARFNRAVALEATGALDDALLDLEAAVTLFDPRLQRPQWEETTRRLVALEQRLAAVHGTPGRVWHVVRIITGATGARRLALMRERMTRLLGASPEVRRREVAALTLAALEHGPTIHDAMLRAVLEVAMELPDEVLQATMLGVLEAHRRLDAAAQESADRRLDVAIQELVMGPQRVRMREVLYAAGWERP